MSDLLQIYNSARKSSLNLCKPLSIDDYNVQPKDEVSPPKWHLAHTTWFFETFILKSFYNNYKVFHPKFDYIFNSYYKGHGEHWKQSRRSLLSRPTVDDVYRYRAYVDRHIAELLETKRPVALELAHLFEVGLNHEEQHQELLIMDIKSIFGSQALKPQYARANHVSGASLGAYKWIDYDVHKLVTIGARPEGFSYDNERPQFSHYLASFSLSDRFITNAEYKDFILAGGYEHSEFWLSQGWDWRQNNSVKNPLYWSRNLEKEFTLLGEISLEPSAPVAHISYYEADAYAKWSGHRLPTEFEMEYHLSNSTDVYDELEIHSFNPCKPGLWSWTSSHYSAYPGFKEFDGKLAEYNGKFMCNQFVLKGGCCATPKRHVRPSYRNFFSPQQRWMFSGIRLAKDSI